MDLKQILTLGIEESKARELVFKLEKYIMEKEGKMKKEFEQNLKALELEMAVERVLFIEKARNIKATKALIDFSRLDKNNIDEKLIRKIVLELKKDESTKFLFEDEEGEAKIKGFTPFESNISKREAKKLSYEELCKYYQNI